MQRNETESVLQKLADRHPYLLLPYHIYNNKFHLADQPVKANFVVQDEEYRENGQLLGKIYHADKLPVIEIYSSNPLIKSRVQMHLTAKYFAKMYLQYIQYLFPAARYYSGKYFTDPTQFINYEIRRRQLDFWQMDMELHFMLKELNAYITQYNETENEFTKMNYFTMEDLKAMIALCDVYKGLSCSAAVQPGQLVRNLDWLGLNMLANYSLATITRTGNVADKPQAVLSMGFVPNVLGLSLANDAGLVLTINEATRMQTKRENENPGAIPQFLLSRMIIENCRTVAEVKEYLKQHQPASSHILTVMDASGSTGVFEMLPNKGPYQTELFHFRGFDAADKVGDAHQVVTNHFLDEEGKFIPGTQACDSSEERYKNIFAAQHDANPINIAKSASVAHTVQSLIFNQDKQGLQLKVSAANAFSAQTDDFSKINVHQTFIDLLSQPDIVNADPEKATIDLALIRLQRLAAIISLTHAELGRSLSQLYSDLVLQLAKADVGSPSMKISPQQVLFIANRTHELISGLFSNRFTIEEKIAALDYYKKHLDVYFAEKQENIDFSTVSTILKEGALGALFGVISNYLWQVGSPILSAAVGGLTAMTVGSYYHTSGPMLFDRRLLNSLNKVLKQEKDQQQASFGMAVK